MGAPCPLFQLLSVRLRDDPYFYLIDPELGWLNVRLQTWLPFTVHVVINGREWLSRALQKQGLGYEQRENCFVDLADMTRSQRLMDRQLKTDFWTACCVRCIRRIVVCSRTPCTTTGRPTRPSGLPT